MIGSLVSSQHWLSRAFYVRFPTHTKSVLHCCSVLQRVAVCYSVLKRVAVCCSVLQCEFSRGVRTQIKKEKKVSHC